MNYIDVSELAQESLPQGDFPASPHADFRLALAPGVRDAIRRHAKEDTSVEICGVLVGSWERDQFGPFAAITDVIRCDAASSKTAEVTFTHESWAQINREMDTRFAEKRIVGWYHSHPDFGIFLSDRDCFIHEHFFSGAGQIAYVVDPVRDLEGIFAWRKGKPALLPHYWVGNAIVTSQASERNDRDRGELMEPGMDARPHDAAQYRTLEGPPLSVASLLVGTCLLLLGFAYGNWRSSWEQKMIIEGAVAHYGYSKVLKLGLDQDLSRIRQALDRWTTAYLSLPSTDAKLSEKDTAGLAKQRQAIGDGLMICGESLARLQEAYALSPQEQAALAMYVNERMAQLHSIDAGRPPAKAKDLLTDPSPARDAKSGPPERPPDGAIPMSNETPAPHLDASTSDADLPPSTSSDNTPAIGDSPVSPTND